MFGGGSEDEAADRGRTDGDLSAILDATLALSETQLMAQIADETGLDGRTMGVLGFSGAMIAAIVAAKDVLGTCWFAPLPFVLVATVLCAMPVFAKGTDFGPTASTFLATYGSTSPTLIRKQLVADLAVACEANLRRAEVKTLSLRVALACLALGLVVSVSLILS